MLLPGGRELGWVDRHLEEDKSWCEADSTRSLTVPSRETEEIEEIVKLVRLSLYSRDLFYGAQAIQWEMEDLEVKPIPSLRTINRILC